MILTHLHPAVITIDGPAASGKSTVGYQLAEHANFLFFDTGVMYRAVTWAVLQADVELSDEATVTQIAETARIDILPASPPDTSTPNTSTHPATQDGRQNTILVNGTDVTWQIRTPEVERNVSVVSAYPGVRQALVQLQRQIGSQYGEGKGEKQGVVMVGRDIGTVVMPDAPLKIYLEASAAERACRRCEEVRARGKPIDYDEVLADILRRDRIDSERIHSPLRAAEDAVIIDTSNLTIEQVIERVINVERRT